MIKALKVTMIVFGVIVVLVGLANIFVPGLWAGMHGMEESTGYLKWLTALIGAVSITAGVWIIVAGRDPLRHIHWVKFAIMWCILALVIHVYSIIKGYVEFSQIAGFIIVDGGFAVALLALYPWRAARSSQ